MYGLSTYHRNNDLFDAFNSFANDFFSGGDMTKSLCRTDIRDEGSKFVLEAELPGFEKEDISLDVNGDRLTLSAQHSTNKDEKDKNGKYIRRERSYGSYTRSFDISGIDSDKITAEYKNGLLILDMPKKNAELPQSRRLQIN